MKHPGPGLRRCRVAALTGCLAGCAAPENTFHMITTLVDGGGRVYIVNNGPPVGDGTILSTRRAGGFVGTYFGMYAYSAAH